VSRRQRLHWHFSALLAAAIVACAIAAPALAAGPGSSAELLAREVVGPQSALEQVQAFAEARVRRLDDAPQTAEQWQAEAEKLRQAVLDRVVFRGEAAAWHDAQTKVEWLETIEGGPGYKIQKLRYEALPGLWIPALLYRPDKLAGRVPAALHVNGHEAAGKATPYKQIRSINLAKRGMLVLNVEWLGMGQLRTENFKHSRMNQIDLCGTSGLAPFYLAMRRGLDVLLSVEQVDPARVAVAGLSGGGWQTIVLSALDTRVKAANPVAGYSSFLTRLQNVSDLGDSEQTPVDLAAIADYTHLTAMLAPRGALLTYNAKDNCCFASDHALPPLLAAARPYYRLLGHESRLRSHVNTDPGTHNFERDNRQVYYSLIRDEFYPGDVGFDPVEIASDSEVKTPEQLKVKLPEANADFHTLALALAKSLPRDAQLPSETAAARAWQKDRRAKLRDMLHAHDYEAAGAAVGAAGNGHATAVYWKLKMNDGWVVPVVELVSSPQRSETAAAGASLRKQAAPRATAIVVADGGHAATAAICDRLLGQGRRVLAVDPFGVGEAKTKTHAYLWNLLVSSVGERPLGVIAGQLTAVARWSAKENAGGPVTIVGVGPRASLWALAAAALDEHSIAGVEIEGTWGSLKELIDGNMTFDQMPEMFCFGLLESFDLPQIAALVAPRPVSIRQPSQRARDGFASLAAWYKTLGVDFKPVSE
jgi:dienelactone hydrolase